MNHQLFSYLLSRYSNDSISLKEQDEFFVMVSTDDYDDILTVAIENDFTRIKLNNSKSLSANANKEIVQNVLNSSKELKLKKWKIKVHR